MMGYAPDRNKTNAFPSIRRVRYVNVSCLAGINLV